MAKQARPLLSIGIIFKNEIRCLERCMDSLEPLRAAIPCQLVMADTGSTDGSREVARRYADILTDFAWINDFAAARNSVMDLCTGKWYLSIDCDEWLGGNIPSLVKFLKKDEHFDYGAVTVRNYKTTELEAGGNYSDFTGIRLLRMSTGIRFQGAIHEHWLSGAGAPEVMLLTQVLLHHDGYVVSGQQWTPEKAERNMSLLREKLEEAPDDLMLLMQCIESGQGTPEFLDYVRRAAEGVEQEKAGWKKIGASICRYAVFAASQHRLPELNAWIQRAERLFPASIYTRIDVNYFAFGKAWEADDYEECVRRGEAYSSGVADYDAGRYDLSETLVSSLLVVSPNWRHGLSTFLAGAYLHQGQPQKAMELLTHVDGTLLNGKQTENLIRICMQLYAESGLDATGLIHQLWEQICSPKPSEALAEERRTRLLRVASGAFSTQFRLEEEGKANFHRHAYGLFRPLEGDCTLGLAAEVLEAAQPEEIGAKLLQIEKWEEFPACALEHALLCGAVFPPPDKTPPLETLDQLALRLAKESSQFLNIVWAGGQNVDTSLPALFWARALVLAAVRIQSWKDPEEGMKLFQQFVCVERPLLPRYYDAGLLTEDTLWALPMPHRFGWYCVQADEAMGRGDKISYLRFLRKGLETAPAMKGMVDFLAAQAKRAEDARRKTAITAASPELVALAEQIRKLLAAYPKDDPAVQALKQSEAYQKVAYLIEKPAAAWEM